MLSAKLLLLTKCISYENIECVGYLYLSRYSRAVHPARHVDCVPPDVILRPSCPNHPCNHWTHIDTCANVTKKSIKSSKQWQTHTGIHFVTVLTVEHKGLTYPLAGQTHCMTDSWFHPERQTSQWRSPLWCSDGRKQTSWPKERKKTKLLASVQEIIFHVIFIFVH